jgi:hypothetical protein
LQGADVTSSRQTARFIGRTAAIAGGLVLLALFSHPALADQVYKCVDAQGQSTFSDRPCAPSAKKTEIAVQQADPAEAARLAKQSQVLMSQDDLRRKQQATQDKSKSQQDQANKAKCQAARDHYNNMKDASRLFKTDADGNRVYYSDAEADTQKEQARQLMSSACGS